MSINWLFSLAGVILLLSACQESSMTSSFPPFPVTYPPTRTEAVVDTYFSTPVEDPYRWLEIDTAADVEAWVRAQNEVTFGYLEQIPFRAAIRKRYEELFNFPKVGAPNKAGDHYFYSKNDGLQNQAVIYVQKGLEGTPEVFLDPNTMSDEGTAAIELIGFSPDNRYVAYSRSDAGSYWSQIRVIEIESKRELDDRLDWVKFSQAAWTNDGFFYSRMPEPMPGMELSQANQFHSVYFHKLGDPQSADKLIYRNELAPQMYHWTSITEDLAYLILYASTGTDGFETYVKDLRKPGSAFKPLFTGFSHKNTVVDYINGHFLVHTDIQAPNYRLIALDPARPDSSNWTDVIPEKEDLLTSVSSGGGRLFANYLKNATTRIYRYDPDGANEQEIQLPGLGSAAGFSGKKNDHVLFYSYASFTDPGTIFRYDVESGASEVFFRTELKFNPEDYEEKPFFPS